MVLTNREHIIALEPLDKGLMGTLLRYPYEVRSEKEYFEDIQDVKITKDMLDLAKHIVEQKSGSFEPEQFEDRYEQALIDLINQKRTDGLSNQAKGRPDRRQRDQPDDALKRSPPAKSRHAPAARRTRARSRRRRPGQREMLLPIIGGGKRAAKETVKEAPRRPRSRRDQRPHQEGRMIGQGAR